MLRKASIIAGALVLAGCQTVPRTVWVRLDGQRITGNPVLEQQGRLDLNACRAEAMQAGGAVVMPGYGTGMYLADIEKAKVREATVLACMNARGYDERARPEGSATYNSDTMSVDQSPPHS